MMVQYFSIKEDYEDYLLFYRMGDFYELFFDDAIIAADALDITLTKRGKHKGKNIHMCGVPAHASEAYLYRLIRKNFKVAVCEQMENPTEAKKRGAKSVVKRAVTRLITAGTLTEDTLLEASTHNYLAAIGIAKDSDEQSLVLSWLDMSTGDFNLMVGGVEQLKGQLAGLLPRELLLSETIDSVLADKFSESVPNASVVSLVGSQSSPSFGKNILERVFHVDSLSGFGHWSRAMYAAAGALVGYVELTQMGKSPAFRNPKIISRSDSMCIDPATRTNLELLQTMIGERKGSLLHSIDMTVTGGGARCLAERLSSPLAHVDEIRHRHDSVTWFIQHENLRTDIRRILRAMPDMLRALTRLSLERGEPRDLGVIRDGLKIGFEIAKLMTTMSADIFFEIEKCHKHIDTHVTVLKQVYDALQKALDIELPVHKREGGFIVAGYNLPLDEARTLRDESRRVIINLQHKYAEKTHIKSLKIKHNAILGYYIEVPLSHGDKLMSLAFREEFIHRQTLIGSVRFSTQELSHLAGEISRSAERALGFELEAFKILSHQIIVAHKEIAEAAESLAILDVSVGLAELAVTREWVCPNMYEDTQFSIQAGRHPVVELALLNQPDKHFIANDCQLNVQESCRIMLLTGPNMAGKSTYLRQNALITILAQIGSFVPADSVDIGVVDQVFSRVGASDDLAGGRSTFMVEMLETAAILNQATQKSLVILDEIGRGTATFDGLSIAWATVEYLHNVNQCRALFATHYHELTSLSEKLEGLSNSTMKVKEHQGDVIFLHEVGLGSADRSYGIHVASLAGFPDIVVERARGILGELEKNRDTEHIKNSMEHLPLFVAPIRAEIQAEKDDLREMLACVKPDELTPREALDTLYALYEHLKKEKE